MGKQSNISDNLGQNDFGYSIEQISGPEIDPRDYSSANQSRNVGGNVQGFVAEIFRCSPGLPVVIVSQTFSRPQEAETAALRLLDLCYKGMPPATPQSVVSRVAHMLRVRRIII